MGGAHSDLVEDTQGPVGRLPRKCLLSEARMTVFPSNRNLKHIS